MATEAELVAVIKARDEASAKIRDIGVSVDAMSKKFLLAGGIMVGFAGALAGGIFKLTQSYAKAGEAVLNMAAKTGFSTQMLSKLKYAAEQSGASLGVIQSAYRTMARQLDDARAGSEGALKEFERLGIVLEDLEGLSPEEQFMRIAMAVAAIEGPLERAAAAQALFGMSGMELLPLLSLGKQGIADLMNQASELGVVFDQLAAEKAAALNAKMTEMQTAFQGASNSLAEQFLPVITTFIEKVTLVVKGVKEWIDVHPELAQWLLWLIGIIGTGGALLIAFNIITNAIKMAAAAVAVLKALIMGPWAVLDIIVAAAAAAAAVALIWKGMESVAGKVPEMPAIPALPGAEKLQGGGIVRRPTFAMLGEAGPEAIVPLSRGGMGSTYNITVQSEVFMGNESEARDFAQKILGYIREDQRRTVGRVA